MQKQPKTTIIPAEEPLAPTQAGRETSIAQHLDEALTQHDEQAFADGINRLWHWVYRLALAQIADDDEAQDLAQEVIIAVYQVAQRQVLSGEQIVGLARSKLAGWRRVPGLITKYQAEEAQRRRLKVSLAESADRAATSVLDTEQQPIDLAYRKDIETHLACWRGSLAQVKPQSERETLQVLLIYVEQRWTDWLTRTEYPFTVSLGTFKRRWRVAPKALDWLKTRLKLKRDGAVRDRLLRVIDLLRLHGLDKPTLVKEDLRQAIDALHQEARWLWHVPIDRETVHVLCIWFETLFNAGESQVIVLEPLLQQEESQFVLDKSLSEYLQCALGLSQNAVRKRVDRIMPTLSEWGLLEVIKDE